MKLLTSITLTSVISLTAVFAQTTMCFKENHSSMSTIESTALDGGVCASTKSVQDMKKEGWSVSDINVEKGKNGTNYIYIFKKDEIINGTALNEDELEQRILKRLEERKKVEVEMKKQKALQRMSQSGKRLYINKCQSCHGEKAEKIDGPSRALVNLDLAEFQTTIRDYVLGQYDRGQAMRMTPYANLMDSNDIKNVYSYIQSFKQKKEPKKEEESK